MGGVFIPSLSACIQLPASLSLFNSCALKDNALLSQDFRNWPDFMLT